MNTLTNEQIVARAALISAGAPRLMEFLTERYKDMDFVIELLSGFPEYEERCQDLAKLRGELHILIESLAMEIKKAS